MTGEVIRRNTTALQEILDIIEDLPEADNGVAKEEQEKVINITENGTTEVMPDEGKALSKVTINTNVSGGSDNNKLNLLAKRTITEVTAEDLQGVTQIHQYMFHECSSLERISLPENITSIGHYAFYNDKKLVLTSLPESTTSIGNASFYSCVNLVLTSLPAGITSIGSASFYNCKGLTTLTFKGTPTSIGVNAFNLCSNLTTINVPWAEGAIANAPWGATNATINYNSVV